MKFLQGGFGSRYGIAFFAEAAVNIEDECSSGLVGWHDVWQDDRKYTTTLVEVIYICGLLNAA